MTTMENSQNPQAPDPQTSEAENRTNRRFQWLPSLNPAQSGEDDEGGLNFGQVIAALRRRLPVIVGVTVVVTSLAMLKALTSKPVYQGGFEILTNPVTVESQVISSVPQTLSSKEGQPSASGKVVDATKLKLLKSPRVLNPIVDQLKSRYPNITYDELNGSLVVKSVPSSEILAVSFQNASPEKVKAILKLVADSFLSYSLAERLADVSQGIEFVNTQVPQLQKRVEGVQDRLQSFRQQNNLIDPESTSKQLAQQSTTIGQQRLDTGIKLNEARALYADLDRELAQQSTNPASPALIDNTRYQSLLTQILTVESDIAKESSLFQDKAPNIRVLRDQRQNLLPLLQREGQRVQEQMASKIRELESRDRILAQAEDQLNQQVRNLSAISRQYADMQQELKIATDNLNQFLAKREGLRIDAGQKKSPWQILTPPGDPVPSTADVRRTTMLGVILGLLLGIGVALLLDKLSNVFHNPEEIKEASKLPVLGVVPFNAELEEIEKITSLGKLVSLTDLSGIMQQMTQKIGFGNGSKASQYNSSPFLESFRSLYTNIRLLSSDTQIRSFVISSSIPGEGKSTISMYVAQAAAALGQRVLLVDTDLRLPKLHGRLGLTNDIGLTHLISLDLEVDQAIQQSLIEPNLFVLTAGQVPPDPTKLLSSQKMQNLMEQFRAQYDLVIYDTPPLQELADTKLIASKTDGIVMIVGLSKTKSSIFLKVLAGIKPFPVAVLGVVANGSKDFSSPLYSSYHRYYASDLEPPLQKASLPADVFSEK
jgi:polysaccharide biosynthesis transport protein